MALNIGENKCLQIIAATILIYFFCMDFALYCRIQALSYVEKAVTSSPNEEDPLHALFSKIAMKTLLLDHPNHYIHVPLSILFNQVTKFSQVFFFITPNMISACHVVVALFGMKLLWSNHLSVRQMGVLLFEVRSFLDALDGTVARARRHHSISHVDVGSSGFLVDGACDTIGSAALYIGAFVFLRSSVPPHSFCSKILPSSLLPLAHTSKDTQDWGPNLGKTQSASISSSQHTRRVILLVLCSAMQMTLGSFFWNQTLDAYHSILELDVSTLQQKAYQIEIFKSPSMWIIICFWRICNPHALLEMIFISIFIDKLWEFLRWTQYSGFVILLILAAVTHAHIIYARSLIESGALVGT